MKVLLLADGSSVHAVRYQAELRSQGVEVLLVSIEAGATVDMKLKPKTGIGAIDYVLTAPAIKNIVKNENFDIINPHFACGYGFMTALSGIWKTKPVLLHCLGSDILVSPRKSSLHKWRVTYALKKSHQVVVDSEYLGTEVKKLFNKTENKVIFWGADKKAFDSFDQKEQSGFVWKQPLKVIVPRAHYPVYNNQFVILALKDLIRNKNLTITFPDWGDDLKTFKEIVAHEQIENGVKYYDFKSREKFNEFISGFDIYLSAALSDSSPASLIEAMASGLYPIVGDIPGVKEWMGINNGILYNLHDTESLTKAFENVLEKPPDLDELLRRNYSRAKKDGVFSKNIAETVALMQEMIDNAGR